MKKFSLILFSLALLIFFSSCSTSKILTSDVKPAEIKELHYFEPISYISLIESGNRAKFNDTLSRFSEQLLQKAVKKQEGKVPVKEVVSIEDTNIKNKIKQEISFMLLSSNSKKKMSKLKITPVIDSILEANGNRFGLITIGYGFTRVKGNYGNQIAKGVAMGILTLGMFYQVPIKSSSAVYVMIVDAKENNIAFFRKSFIQDNEPLDENNIMEQIRKLFDGYFWNND
jgi:hypothetical protein